MVQGSRTTADTYTVRQFASGDFEEFRSLFESVWDRRLTRRTFEWKYGEENPFSDHVPIVLAERNGDVVGAKPHIPIRLRAGEETPLALLGTDTMVHEDHRRRGLFSRMVAHTLDRYADREPVLTFNFPNENSRRGYRKQGWYVLDNHNSNAYRIQDPKPFVRHYGGPAGALGAPIADAGTRIVNTLLGEFRDSAEGVTVEANPSNAPATLGSIPRRAGEPKLHVERDETFYRWLLTEPTTGDESAQNGRTIDQTAYVAYGRDEPVAGAVVRTVDRSDSGYRGFRTMTDIVDVVPPASEDRSDVVTSVLERVLEDAHASQVVRAPENALPRENRRALGFVGVTNPPISHFVEPPNPLALRPLGEQFTVGGVVTTDPESWLVTGVEVR